MDPAGWTVRRAAERYRTDAGAITSWHCFAAGGHYDPANVSFGALVGTDEHLLAPGAGFDWHEHRGVVITSYVLEGTLRHQSGGLDRLVRAGELLRQDASEGVRHRETNGSAGPLRFVQTTWLAGAPVVFELARGGLRLGGWAHLFVAAGTFECADRELRAGDSVRVDAPLEQPGPATPLELTGSGTLLVCRITAPQKPL